MNIDPVLTGKTYLHEGSQPLCDSDEFSGLGRID